MSRAIPHRLTPEHVRSAIFRLSNRLRQSPHLIYEFDGATRIVLMQVRIDPDKAWKQALKFVREADSIPDWAAVLDYCKEAQFDLSQFCKLQRWRLEDLERLYRELRGVAQEVRSTPDDVPTVATASGATHLPISVLPRGMPLTEDSGGQGRHCCSATHPKRNRTPVPSTRQPHPRTMERSIR